MGSHSGLGSEEIELQPVGSEEPPNGSRSAFHRKFSAVSAAINSMDNVVNKSTFGRTFRLRGCGHVSHSAIERPDSQWTDVSFPRIKEEEIPGANFSTELRAGMTTFATMAYIIAVNVSLATPLASNDSENL